jgi:ectoine hydroxylase-related dioxygenase (phytanoyl-CoA dioxygenase family)
VTADLSDKELTAGAVSAEAGAGRDNVASRDHMTLRRSGNGNAVLSQADLDRYERDGFIVVPDVLSDAEVASLREATDEFVAKSRMTNAHNEVFDLEPGHSVETPRVRRIKTPDRWDPRFAAMVRHPGIITCLQALWGESVRFDTSKLNMKAAGFGSPVEWHQDWAFYPHTNDDLAAVGIMIDDIDAENGPLLVVPGTHRGPVYDHHAEGVFCGAIDPAKVDLDFGRAVACTGKAGSITIHHVRAVHGSAPNSSARPRRLFLLQFRSADAWPLVNGPPDWAAWHALMVAGEDTLEPRCAAVPVRLPLPPATHQGSIYENQRGLTNRFFGM